MLQRIKVFEHNAFHDNKTCKQKHNEIKKTIDKTQGKIETKQNSKSKALHIMKVLHIDEGVVNHKKYKDNYDTTTKGTS